MAFLFPIESILMIYSIWVVGAPRRALQLRYQVVRLFLLQIPLETSDESKTNPCFRTTHPVRFHYTMQFISGAHLFWHRHLSEYATKLSRSGIRCVPKLDSGLDFRMIETHHFTNAARLLNTTNDILSIVNRLHEFIRSKLDICNHVVRPVPPQIFLEH